MNRLKRPLRVLGVGTLLLVLCACTSGTEVNTSQVSTERELVLVQGPDATSQALGHAYRSILEDAGIDARLLEAAEDPLAKVLAGEADVTIAGSSRLLGALSTFPGAKDDLDAAAGTGTDAGTDDSASGTPSGDGAEPTTSSNLDLAETTRQLHGLRLTEFAVLDTAEAQRTGTLVVTAATSAGNQLVSVDGLKPLCPKLDFGISRTMFAQLTAELDDELSCKPHGVIELSDEKAAGVLPVISDEVQVQASTLSNAGIPDNALVVLQGASKLFAPEAITPLITTEGVGQDAVRAINKLTAALKQEDILQLNRMVNGRDAVTPARAATDWLADKALVKTP